MNVQTDHVQSRIEHEKARRRQVRHLEAEEESRQVQEFSRLNEREATAVWLRMMGFSYKRIAGFAGVTRNTVTRSVGEVRRKNQTADYLIRRFEDLFSRIRDLADHLFDLGYFGMPSPTFIGLIGHFFAPPDLDLSAMDYNRLAVVEQIGLATPLDDLRRFDRDDIEFLICFEFMALYPWFDPGDMVSAIMAGPDPEFFVILLFGLAAINSWMNNTRKRR